MSSFRDMLGEHWLKYQHHLDGAADEPQTQSLPNGLNTTARPSTSSGRRPSPPSLDVPELLPPPLLSSEPKARMVDMDEDQETESTLQWPGHMSQPTESTLEDSMVDAPLAGSPEQSPSARGEILDVKEEGEEEEDLGGTVAVTSVAWSLHLFCLISLLSLFLSSLVDLCHPLLVGVLSEKEEEDGEGQSYKRSTRREVFLCIKPGLVLEMDMKHGRERCRLELSSLARVETTEAAWTRGVRGRRRREGGEMCV